jgi:DNA (cytosine-5)-methyltransferase 1
VRRPRCLDLFCGAGGAAMGLHLAGFDVVGVDHEPQPRYPFEFHQADAMTFPLDGFDFIWASPPCQHASTLRHMHKDRDYPALIGGTRDRLRGAGVPWVIENVMGSEMRRGSVVLCGSMFRLGAVCADGEFHQLRRHRVFETSVLLIAPSCHHVGRPVGVYGNGGGNASRAWRSGVNGFTGKASERREAMGIDWMNRYELSQAIPPAYSRWIGEQMMPLVLAAPRKATAGAEGRHS